MTTARPASCYDIFGTKRNSRWRGLRMTVCAIVVAGATAGCQTVVDRRGFIPAEKTLDSVRIGMPRSQVEELLGTPSAQSNYAGTRYYYISSVFETTAFYNPEEVDRKVYAVAFDQTDNVNHLAYYGMKDGKIFDFISRTTPTRGKEFSYIAELFGNIGRFGSGRGDGNSIALPGKI